MMLDMTGKTALTINNNIWGSPTYKYHGPLVHFVARKKYISFIVVSRSVMETFKNELKPFDTSGTTIHFSAENPLPADLVRKIVELRSKENEERDASDK